MKIVQFGNQILEQPAQEVALPLNEEDRELIDEMLATIQKRASSSGGLAAPQVGVSKRICIVRRFDLEKGKKKSDAVWEILINPKLISKSEDLSTEWEGCLSINNGELWGQVSRPRFVEIEYFDINGVKHVVKAQDFQSHVYQHEIDHLDGILFLKYIDDPSSLLTTEELRKRY